MTKELYLSFPNRSQLAVFVQITDDGLLVQAVNFPHIRFTLGGLTALQAAMSPAPERRAVDPLGLSPADVVRYFQQSAILSIYVDDVKSALQGQLEATGGDYQLQQDLQAVAGLISPSQADIAERLFGDRTKTGGSYRRRILAVMSATTTSQQPAESGSGRGSKAA